MNGNLDKEGQMAKHYETPQVRSLGTVSELTAQLDGQKIGSVDDILTPIVPLLDGDIEIGPDGSMGP
jgi:hypothetical protein